VSQLYAADMTSECEHQYMMVVEDRESWIHEYVISGGIW